MYSHCFCLKDVGAKRIISGGQVIDRKKHEHSPEIILFGYNETWVFTNDTLINMIMINRSLNIVELIPSAKTSFLFFRSNFYRHLLL